MSLRRLLIFVAILAASFVAYACSDDARAGGNALSNAGFEDGKDGWTSLATQAWEPRFDLSGDVSHSGTQSAFLRMRTSAGSPETRIWGVTQEVSPDTFPEHLRGWYRVEDWQRAAPKQYMQIVVIAFASDNVPEARFPNHQIRYILNGISEPPFEIANAKYVFVETGDPRQGEWVSFDLAVGDDFRRLWGDVPKGYDKIRMLFEVRYDDKTVQQLPSANVYFDDLYFGDEAAAAETAG